MGQTPEQLTELLQQGYRFALALTHEPARAEDLLHDAWIACLRAGQSEHRPYLIATIHHRFVDEYRRARRAPIEPLADGSREPAAAEDADAPLEIVNGNLERALARLLPEERAAMYLAYAEDWPIQQIAELLGRPRGSVLSMLHRVRGRLRCDLESLERSRP